MSVTVPASDINGAALQAQVTLLQTIYNNAIAASPVNAAQANSYLQQLTSAQVNLINYLIANAFDRTGNVQPGIGVPTFLTPAGILSAGTINT